MISLSTFVACAVLLGATLSVSNPAFAAGWYADREAGIRFPEPFEDGERKTGAQIKALMLDKETLDKPAPGVIPEGHRITSGLYDKSGLPFLLIWVRDDERPPTQTELEEQEFDLVHLRKVIEAPASNNAALQSRVLAQVVKGRTSFIGLYFDPKTGAHDAKILDRLVQDLEVDPEVALRFDDLGRGRPSFGVTMGLAAFAGAAAIGTAIYMQRRRRTPF